MSAEEVIGSRLKTLQPPSFDQFTAEPAVAKCGGIVAEARPGDAAKPDIVGARTVAVSALEAEVDSLAYRQAGKICVYVPNGRPKARQNIQRRAGRGDRSSAARR